MAGADNANSSQESFDRLQWMNQLQLPLSQLCAELTFNALPGFLGGLSLKQGVFYAFNGEDGIAGRSVLSLDFAPDLGFVRPRLSANFGGVYGEGVQDGLVAGPELALDINLPGGFTVRPKVAYDYQFRNPD